LQEDACIFKQFISISVALHFCSSFCGFAFAVSVADMLHNLALKNIKVFCCFLINLKGMLRTTCLLFVRFNSSKVANVRAHNKKCDNTAVPPSQNQAKKLPPSNKKGTREPPIH
jgi:hypothetical protein